MSDQIQQGSSALKKVRGHILLKPFQSNTKDYFYVIKCCNGEGYFVNHLLPVVYGQCPLTVEVTSM